MTTITIDRATVEQALEAWDGGDIEWFKRAYTVMENLRAALAQEPTPPPEARTEAEKTAYAAGWWDALRKAQQAEPAQKPITRLFGTLPVHDAQQAEPVEPVAWLYTGIKQDGTEHGPHLVWKPEYMDAMSASKGAKATPLYTAPPQRKPLTEEEIDAVWDQWFGAYGLRGPGGPYTRRGFARAVERAHGITDPQVADHLARHGIPMPGDPK